MNRTCPVPLCIEPVPTGPHAVFCPEHHFQLPYLTTNALFKLQIACTRTDNDEDREHLKEQIAAYINVAVRTLTEKPRGA